MKKYIPLAFLLLLNGCASTPVPLNEATQVSADRVIAFQSPDPARSATLTVVRDGGFAPGGGCFRALWVNQVLAARLDTSEVAKFYVEPGELLLRVGRDPQGRGLCAPRQDHWVQRETILKPGEHKAFRITTGDSGQYDIIRTDIEQPKE